MFGFVRLIGLRMKTIAVVELDYGRKLEVAGGPDTPTFNQATRIARDMGGNEYDAAALFMMVDGVGAVRRDVTSDDRMAHIAAVYQRNRSRMARADLTEEALGRAVGGGEL
jgi:hypothetical protein